MKTKKLTEAEKNYLETVNNVCIYVTERGNIVFNHSADAETGWEEVPQEWIDDMDKNISDWQKDNAYRDRVFGK